MADSKNYLPLSKDQEDRVRRCVRDDEPVAILKTSEELHYAAAHWNWDYGSRQLIEIISRSECSLATASLIFWRGLPTELFFSASNREEALKEDLEADTFDLLVQIQEGVKNKKFTAADIGYDPTDDNGTDWTEDWDDPRLKIAIDPELVKRIEGRQINPEILF